MISGAATSIRRAIIARGGHQLDFRDRALGRTSAPSGTQGWDAQERREQAGRSGEGGVNR